MEDGGDGYHDKIPRQFWETKFKIRLNTQSTLRMGMGVGVVRKEEYVIRRSRPVMSTRHTVVLFIK